MSKDLLHDVLGQHLEALLVPQALLQVDVKVEMLVPQVTTKFPTRQCAMCRLLKLNPY